MHNLVFDPPPPNTASRFGIYLDTSFGNAGSIARLAGDVVVLLATPHMAYDAKHSLIDCATRFLQTDAVSSLRPVRDLLKAKGVSEEQFMQSVLDHSALVHLSWLNRDDGRRDEREAVLCDAWDVLRNRQKASEMHGKHAADHTALVTQGLGYDTDWPRQRVACVNASKQWVRYSSEEFPAHIAQETADALNRTGSFVSDFFTTVPEAAAPTSDGLLRVPRYNAHLHSARLIAFLDR